MNNNCIWEEFETPDERGWRRVRCSKCGFETNPTPHSLDRIFRPAGCTPYAYERDVASALATIENNPLPLGDITAAGLEAIGITKERWNAWKGEAGPCQSCAGRQEWLNKIGRKIVDFLRGPTSP